MHLWHNEYVKINCNKNVADWVKNGVPIILGDTPNEFEINNHVVNDKHKNFIALEIKRLLEIDAIEKSDDKPRCVSPINVVPKKGGKLRLIFDLRELNKHCRTPHFAHEDIRTVKSMICHGDNLATIDLKDGFLHIPVRECDRKYLGFYWDGQYYQYKKLPFGLSLSPYYFCKILRPVISYLRSLGIRVVVYVDDFILMAEPRLFTDHLDTVLHTLADLGWLVNMEKSHLNPSHSKQYLGYNVTSSGNSGYPEIAIVRDRVRKLKSSIKKLLTCENVSARKLASITGQCVSMTQVIVPAKLHLRECYRVLKQRTDWNDYVAMSPAAVSELKWWLTYVEEWNTAPVIVRPTEIQLVTDASHIAWGATLGELQASGQWNVRMSHQSSNVRELMGILMAIQAFRSQLRGKSVQILTDNISAMAYIVHQGGPNRRLTHIAKAIWSLALDINMHMEVAHISGVQNVEADRLSRIVDKYNWMLHPRLFTMIDHMYGPHTIDRFASTLNAQLPRFNSRFWEPGTEGVDALAQQNWGREINFVNAPFRMLPKVIDVIRQQQATATVIAPYWPAQPWFHQLRSMLTTDPLRLPNTTYTFRYMGATPEPLKNKRWRIYAWPVSGRTD